MPASPAQVVVAGHICLDIIPAIEPQPTGLAELLRPGRLLKIGPAVLAPGGPVANAGLALHRLGVSTRLMGKVGDDLFGEAICRLVRSHGPHLTEHMITAAGEHTSYTVVISPPAVDRIFLHCPGANDSFSADDVPYDRLAGARVFHFGYPPLMRRMYADGGCELEEVFSRVKALGIATSLDMAMPAPHSEASRADWHAILARVLPHVDVFLPSLDEMLALLHREATAAGPAGVDGSALSALGAELLAMGAAVVGLKLGEQGLYLRSTSDPARLAGLRGAVRLQPETWRGRELYSPCFEVDVVGTTGCGDCTIAGFLAATLRGLPLEEAATTAVAVGACNVERPDATSGVPSWEALRQRLGGNWRRRAAALPGPGWSWTDEGAIALGPGDTLTANRRPRSTA